MYKTIKKLNKDQILILNRNHIKPIIFLTKQDKFDISKCLLPRFL